LSRGPLLGRRRACRFGGAAVAEAILATLRKVLRLSTVTLIKRIATWPFCIRPLANIWLLLERFFHVTHIRALVSEAWFFIAQAAAWTLVTTTWTFVTNAWFLIA
jgi:hypothetical protein